MEKPNPEDFGLTPEKVNKLKVAKETPVYRRYVLFCTIFGSSFIYFFFSALTFWGKSVGSIVGAFLLSLFLSAVLWFLCDLTYHLARLVREIFNRDLSRLKRFKEAEQRYEQWVIRTQRQFWQSLGGRSFENEVASLLDKLGYGATVTRGSGDRGVDIFLKDGKIIQCKAHKSPVGPAIIRELYGTLHHFNAPKAILLSTSGFTTGVLNFARDKPIELWDVDTLINFQKDLDK